MKIIIIKSQPSWKLEWWQHHCKPVQCFPTFWMGSTCCVFRPAYRCAQHPKAGRNTQQPALKTLALESQLKPISAQSLEQPWEPGWIVLPGEVGVDGGAIDSVAIAAATFVTVQGLVGAEGLFAFITHEHLDKVWLFLKQKMKNVIKINGVRIWKPIIQYRKDHLAFDLWMQGSIS